MANIYLWADGHYPIDMTDQPPSRTQEKIVVRLPDGMRARLKAVADENNRSVNAEVVARLEASFEAEKIEEIPEIQGIIHKYEERHRLMMADLNERLRRLEERVREE